MAIPGDVFGRRYRLRRRIGMGGMGVVHEAVDTQLGRRVAIKVLRGELPADGVVEKRLRRETRALARVSHPNVVTLHDSGVHEGAPYLVMEFLDGTQLSALASEYGPLDPEVVRGLAVGICSGLAAAHSAGILHRDVKPSNVRIATSGRVVLQDFGIVRLTDESTTLTRTGALLGTPQYMAPELIMGHPPGEPTDFYGLGLCLYMALTGEAPFEDDTGDIGPLVLRVVEQGAPKLRGSRHSGIPADLAEVVDRLTSTDPRGRPQHAAEVLRQLGSADPQATEELRTLVNRRIRDRAVDDVARPEYLDVTPTGGIPRPDGISRPSAEPPTGSSTALSLSDMTRELVMERMTPKNAVSRQREAVNLVQRGELQEAVRMLTALTRVCSVKLGSDDPTTLASRYWQGVCLAKLGAREEALSTFAKVTAEIEPEKSRPHRSEDGEESDIDCSPG